MTLQSPHCMKPGLVDKVGVEGVDPPFPFTSHTPHSPRHLCELRNCRAQAGNHQSPWQLISLRRNDPACLTPLPPSEFLKSSLSPSIADTPKLICIFLHCTHCLLIHRLPGYVSMITGCFSSYGLSCLSSLLEHAPKGTSCASSVHACI